MFELSGVNYEEVLEQGDSILVRIIASSSYRGFELSGLYCNYKITVCLHVHAFVFEMMSRLIAKGIIRSYSMRHRRIDAAVKSPFGIISNCDVCGGLMFNAQRYMHMNDVYFAPSLIRFPYEMKKIFDRILHELQYLNSEHPRHFTLV